VAWETHKRWLELRPAFNNGEGVMADPKVDYYLTQSVYKVVLQKSIPAQIRQLILYYDYY